MQLSTKLKIRSLGLPSKKSYALAWRYILTEISGNFNEELILQLQIIPSKEFISFASPFLLYKINNLISKLHHGRELSQKDSQTLIGLAIDCLWPILPNGFYYENHEKENGNLFFPLHGKFMKPEFTLQERFRIDTLNEVLGEKSYAMEFRAPFQFSIVSYLPPELVGQARSESIEKNLDFQNWGLELRAALIIIRKIAPALFDRMSNSLQYFVPLKSESPETHLSFTLDWMPGVIFLSKSKSPIHLAEAIVHEFGHFELNEVDISSPIFIETPKSTLCYSPWREDPRPPIGLFHALYVFSEVIGLLEGIIADENLAEEKSRVEERRSLILKRIKIGLSQIPKKLLTPLGTILFERIGDFAYARKSYSSKAAAAVKSHLFRWKETNPGLTIAVAENVLRS